MSAQMMFHKQHKARLARIEAQARARLQSKVEKKVEVEKAVEVTKDSVREWCDRQMRRHNPWFFIVEGPIDPPPPVYSYPTIEKIQKTICAYYGITMTELLSERRSAYLVRPRQVGFHLCRRLTPRSYPEIARRFGGRDHTTALFGDRKIKRLMAEDEGLKAAVDELIAQLGGEQ